MGIVIKAGNVVLPSPDAIKTSDEIIWSANTGRSSTGKMIGDVISEKTTFAIQWGVLTKAERDMIRSNLSSGFHPFSVIEDGTTTTIDSYRSAITFDTLGTFGGATYFNNMQVSIIQQ